MELILLFSSIILMIYWIFQVPTSVYLSEQKMEIIDGDMLPTKVLNVLRKSNNPKNTNPWGEDFLQKKQFSMD